MPSCKRGRTILELNHNLFAYEGLEERVEQHMYLVLLNVCLCVSVCVYYDRAAHVYLHTQSVLCAQGPCEHSLRTIAATPLSF